MASLLAPFAAQQIILPRSRDDIFQHLQEFMVATIDDGIAGTAAVHVYGSNLAEIRSLVVAPGHQGLGIGRSLVQACERWGATLGVESMFALTYAPDFFVRLGYSVVPKESLPHKIWTVCIHCRKFTHCDEIAVSKNLAAAPVEPVPLAPVLEIETE